MKTRTVYKILAMSLVAVMIIGTLPISALASTLDYNADALTDHYYKLISKKDWELAPGVQETEIVLNNAEGSLRQVVHSVKVDMNNPYTKVIPGYRGMVPTPGNYGVEATSTQAKNAEALGYGNVVAATNAMLSWYNSSYYINNPHLIGEPLYYNILDGYYYENSQGAATFTSKNAVVVINYNYHPVTGEKRPDNIPRVLMRSQTDPLTGWEENAISVWEWLVKPDENGVPKPTYSVNHTSGFESRTFVGITADGEIILSVADGRQAPYSSGFNMYEMGEYMVKMGCIYAANCDGGGSTTFVSERPGEELKVNCSLSDGGERPTTNTFLVISTASASGTFERASLSTEYDYYTPGSSVAFDALGTDAVGTKVDIPDDVSWAIKEEGMGTISNGVFVSNGTPGKVTAQMIYNGKVVGERTITLAIPDKLSFSQPVVTIPYGTRAMIPVKATLNGLYEIGISPADVVITSSNLELGMVDGLHFIGAPAAPAENSSALTVTLKSDPSISASATLKLGQGSVVMWDFEDGQSDIDEWNSVVIRNPGEAHRDFYHKLSLATKEDGKVHNGNYSMRLETNGLSSKDVHSQQYAYVRLGLKDQKISLENARSLGFWLYVPEDNIQCWVQGFYKYDSNGDGKPDMLAEVNLMNSENIYYNVDESGWHYLSMDLSDFEKVDLTYSSPFDADPSDGANTGDKDEFFLVLIFHKAINNILWQTNGSINGPFTYYIDNITVDYSEAVEDREAPIFDTVVLNDNGTKKSMSKHSVVTSYTNVLNIEAPVAEATYRTDGTGTKHILYNYTGLNSSSAKVYVDGVNVPCVYQNGKIVLSGVAVADGYHRVKFEICDNAGNMSTVVRMVKVESGVKSSTIQLVPADPSLDEADRLNFGSVFWMNMVASDIETIQSVTTVIDLNSVNHWQLDHMILADGFSATYTIDDETNSATITFTRTGNNYNLGETVLAKLPIRIIYFDTDMKIPGLTAETVWTKYQFWPHDLKVDVDKGEITYVSGYTSSVLPTFSNEKFQVNTEMYTDYQRMGSDPYLTEHGSTHVHTPVAMPDKAASCSNGYIGRTWCDVCNSVVDWGTPLKGTGEHNYAFVDGKLTCTVGGETFSGTYINGMTYVDGVAAQGWDGESYYKNGEKLFGVHIVDGKYYDFGTDGICPGKMPLSLWYTNENGESFYLDAGVPMTPYTMINTVPTFFYDNGVAFQGPVVINGETCIFEKGAFVKSTTAEVRLAGRAGPKAYFVLYTDGTFVLCGEGATWDYVSVGKTYLPNLSWKNRPWGNQLHEHTQSIKKIIVGKDITKIGNYTFNGTHNLIELQFEEGSKLEAIGGCAFNYAHKLASVELPDSVKTLDGASFGYCLELKYISIPGGCDSISNTAFAGITPTKLTLSVDDQSYAYKYAQRYGFVVDARPIIPDVIDSGSCGVNVTWELDEFGKLSIKGSGAMYDYKALDVPWTQYRRFIKSIFIGKDVTTIGNYAFAWCEVVTEVIFEEGSKVESIGTAAFYYMLKLESVVLPETVKSIGISAFGSGNKLTYIYIPENATYIDDRAFIDSNPELTLDVGESSYAHKFAVAKGYKVITRPITIDIIASGSCGVNVTWELDEFGKLSIKGSGAMYDYGALDVPWTEYRRIITSVFIGKDVTAIGNYAFAWCEVATEVIFEEGSKLETIGNAAFYYMLKLQSIVLPETVKSIGASGFGHGSKLTYVYIPEDVNYIADNAFINNNAELTLAVGESSYAHKFAVAKGYKVITRPITIDIIASGSCGENVRWELDEFGKLSILGSGAMYDYGALDVPWTEYRRIITSVFIGKDVTAIGNYAFAWCEVATEVIFEEGSKLETIGNAAFYYMLKLQSILLPETVKSIGASGFGHGSKLTYVYIPEDVNYIADNAFINNNAELTLAVGESSYAHKFAVAKGYKVITRPITIDIIASGVCGENVTWELDEFGKLSIKGSGAMYDYGALDVPWTECRRIITSVFIGKDVTAIGNYAFAWCEVATEVIFEEGSKLETIGNAAFYYMLKLESIVLPEAVKSLGASALGYGSKLTYIYIPENITFIADNAFINNNAELTLNVAENSYAHEFAVSKGISFELR